MARTRGSRTPRNWAEHQDRHRAGCEPAPAILSSGQSVRQRSKIAYGISSHVTVALLPSCKGAGFEAPPIPLAIQSHWMNSSTADERAGPSGVAPMSVGGTKRNCLAARGISGAEGRPGVPSACRQPPPVTQTGPSRGLRRTGGEGSDAFLRAPPICSNRAGFVTLTGVEQGAAQQSTPTMPSRSGAARDVAVGGIAPGRRVQRFRAVDSKFVATDCG
jgi:hypothetical protein